MWYDFLNNADLSLISCAKPILPLDPHIKTYNERIVEHYELDYIYDGGSGMIINEGVPVSLSRGMLFLRNPGMRVEGIPPYCSYYTIIKIESDYKINLPEMIFDKNSQLEPLFEQLYLTYISATEPLRNFKIKMLLSQIFYNTYEISTTLQTEGDSYIKRAISFIEENYAKKITLTEIEQYVRIDKYRLCRLMTSSIGVSPIQYLNNYRVNMACMMLLKTDISVKEVCYACGFSGKAGFHKFFKERIGKTPDEFKKYAKLYLL